MNAMQQKVVIATIEDPRRVPPRAPGHFVFNGARRIRDAIYEHINEPVEVVSYKHRPGETELAVRMIGRTSTFRLENFNGTWARVNLGEAA